MNEKSHQHLKNLIEIHFDSLINHIEKVSIHNEDSCKKEMVNRLNDLKNFNINCFSLANSNSDQENEFETKWKVFISNEKDDYEDKLDMIKSEYIKKDALIYFNNLENSNECHLMFTEWFNSRKIILFIRYVIF